MSTDQLPTTTQLPHQAIPPPTLQLTTHHRAPASATAEGTSKANASSHRLAVVAAFSFLAALTFAAVALFFVLGPETYSLTTKFALATISCVAALLLLFGEPHKDGNTQLTTLGKLGALALAAGLLWGGMGIVADKCAADTVDADRQKAQATIDEISSRLRSAQMTITEVDGELHDARQDLAAIESNVTYIKEHVPQATVDVRRATDNVQAQVIQLKRKLHKRR